MNRIVLNGLQTAKIHLFRAVAVRILTGLLGNFIHLDHGAEECVSAFMRYVLLLVFVVCDAQCIRIGILYMHEMQ